MLFFFTSILSIILISAFAIYNHFVEFENASKKAKENLIIQERHKIKQDTYTLYNAIERHYQTKSIEFKNDIKNKTYEAARAINLINVHDIDHKDTIARIEDILEVLKEKGKYSIYDYNGDNILKSFDFKRSDINSFVYSKHEDIYTTTLENGKTTVLSYAVNLDSLSAVLVYSSDIENLMSSFISNIESIVNSMVLDKTKYYYIFDKNKKRMLFSDREVFKLKNGMEKLKNIYAQDILEIVDINPKEGYLEKKILINNESRYDVITFVKYYNELDWVIGSGFYADEFEKLSKKLENDLFGEFVETILKGIIYILFVIIICFTIGFYYKTNFDYISNKYINAFSKAYSDNETIDIESIDFNELKEFASNINEAINSNTIKKRMDDENLLFLNQYKKAVDISSIVSKTNKDGVITFVNDAFCDISGFSREEIIGNTHHIVRHPEMNKHVYKDVWDTLKTNNPWQGIFKNLNKFSQTYYLEVIIIPILNAKDEIEEYLGIGHDITNLVEQSKKIEANLQDSLTKLPSRNALIEEINRHPKKAIIAMFDLLNFKHINEYHGFDVGDEIIIEISHTVERLISSRNLTLYKLASDNFAIFASADYWSSENLYNVCNDIIKYFEQHPINIKGNKFDINLIFGISDQPNYFITAEMAKDYAKTSGSHIVVFSDKKDILIKNVHITQSIRNAIENNRIIVYTQAIVDNKTKEPMKYECLMRIADEEDRIIPPIVFLDAAKRSKLYPKLTQIMISKAFKFFAKNNQKFSINLAIEDILSKETTDFLKESLEVYESIAQRLTIEIVEDEGIQNYEEVRTFIDNMKRLGCTIAIDDFGTGYSNFEYLVNLKADVLKIDGSLIKSISNDKEMLEIVKLIVHFAKKLNMRTIAEYVSSKEIADIVDELGIDSSQGFLYDTPKPIDLQ